MIEFECPKCDRRQSFKDNLAGTDFRCDCGALLEIPSLEDFEVVRDADAGPPTDAAFGTPIDARENSTIALGRSEPDSTIQVDKGGRAQHEDSGYQQGGPDPRFVRKKEVRSKNSDRKDACTYGMLAHASAYASFILPSGNIVGPLVVWLSYREQFDFVDEHGKEAVNFQISMMLYAFGLAISIIGILALPILLVFALVMPIIAALKANNGEDYRYPLTIRFIK